MARANEVKSKIVLLQDSVPLDNVSGWLIWELAIVVGFIFLSLMTLFFLLSRNGVFKKTSKKSAQTGKSRKAGFLWFRKGGSKSGTKRRPSKSKKGVSAAKKKKTAYTGKKKRKPGASKPKKLPFLPDPSIIKSYTGKYLAGKRIKANWERVGLVGYDSDEVPLNLEVYQLTKAFQWPPGQSDAIIHRKETVNPKKYLKNKSLKKSFLKATGLISVGVVTEISDGNEKDGLARARAEKMVDWLKPIMPQMQVDYLLSLDVPKNEWGTIDEEVRKIDEQRPVLWICLKESSEEVNMEEALRDALSQAIHLPFDFDIYQEVTLVRIDKN